MLVRHDVEYVVTFYAKIYETNVYEDGIKEKFDNKTLAVKFRDNIVKAINSTDQESSEFKWGEDLARDYGPSGGYLLTVQPILEKIEKKFTIIK